MNTGLSVAIVAGLCAMVGWGAADFFAKKTIDKIGDLRTLFWSQLIGVIPLLIAFLAHPVVPALKPHDPLFLILFGAVSGLSYLPLYAGFGKGKVSLLSPIFASYSVVVVILAAIFLHSTVSHSQYLALLVVFIGILLMNTDPRELRSILKRKRQQVAGVSEVLSAMLIYSGWLVFLDKFLNGKQWLFYLLAIRSFSVVALAVYSFVTQQVLAVTERALWKFLAVIGLFDVGAFSAVSYGYSHTSYVGIVTVLAATFSLPTIALAYVFLKERFTALQAAAAGLILAGVVLISLT